MKKFHLYIFGMIIFFTACKCGPHSSKQKTNEAAITLGQPGKEIREKVTVIHPDIPVLTPGKDTIQLNLEMHAGQHVTILVDVLSADTIFGKLLSDDKRANIRFTQIALPGHNFDGPFDRELIYSVKKQGRYALIIGQNMMAGDPWNGKFTLKVWVK